MNITPTLARAELDRRAARNAGMAYSESVSEFLHEFSSDQVKFVTSNTCSGAVLKAAAALVPTRGIIVASASTPGGRRSPRPSPSKVKAATVNTVKDAANAAFKAAFDAAPESLKKHTGRRAMGLVYRGSTVKAAVELALSEIGVK